MNPPIDGLCHCDHCTVCDGRYICHCLRITEEAVVQAVTRFALQTVDEVRVVTGAGSGCTACHYRIRQVIERSRVSTVFPLEMAS